MKSIARDLVTRFMLDVESLFLMYQFRLHRCVPIYRRTYEEERKTKFTHFDLNLHKVTLEISKTLSHVVGLFSYNFDNENHFYWIEKYEECDSDVVVRFVFHNCERAIS